MELQQNYHGMPLSMLNKDSFLRQETRYLYPSRPVPSLKLPHPGVSLRQYYHGSPTYQSPMASLFVRNHRTGHNRYYLLAVPENGDDRLTHSLNSILTQRGEAATKAFGADREDALECHSAGCSSPDANSDSALSDNSALSSPSAKSSNVTRLLYDRDSVSRPGLVLDADSAFSDNYTLPTYCGRSNDVARPLHGRDSVARPRLVLDSELPLNDNSALSPSSVGSGNVTRYLRDRDSVARPRLLLDSELPLNDNSALSPSSVGSGNVTRYLRDRDSVARPRLLLDSELPLNDNSALSPSSVGSGNVTRYLRDRDSVARPRLVLDSELPLNDNSALSPSSVGSGNVTRYLHDRDSVARPRLLLDSESVLSDNSLLPPSLGSSNNVRPLPDRHSAARTRLLLDAESTLSVNSSLPPFSGSSNGVRSLPDRQSVVRPQPVRPPYLNLPPTSTMQELPRENFVRRSPPTMTYLNEMKHPLRPNADYEVRKTDGEYDGQSSQPLDLTKSRNEVSVKNVDSMSESSDQPPMLTHPSILNCRHALKTQTLASKTKVKSGKTRMKSEAKVHQCPYCGKEFPLAWKLKINIRVHTGEKLFQCHICGRRFSVKCNLRDHIQLHTGERRWKCSQCSAKFSWPSQLKAHVRVHSGEKPYKCQYCDMAFAWSSSRTHHERVHRGEKRYQCSQCPMKFQRKSAMDNHTRTHTGVRPFQCSFCQQMFPHKTTLKQHERLHTGETPYQCTHCNERFRTLRRYRKHTLLAHNPEYPFLCKICLINFKKDCDLEEHNRILHRDQPAIEQQNSAGKEDRDVGFELDTKDSNSEKKKACHTDNTQFSDHIMMESTSQSASEQNNDKHVTEQDEVDDDSSHKSSGCAKNDTNNANGHIDACTHIEVCQESIQRVGVKRHYKNPSGDCQYIAQVQNVSQESNTIYHNSENENRCYRHERLNDNNEATDNEMNAPFAPHIQSPKYPLKLGPTDGRPLGLPSCKRSIDDVDTKQTGIIVPSSKSAFSSPKKWCFFNKRGKSHPLTKTDSHHSPDTINQPRSPCTVEQYNNEHETRELPSREMCERDEQTSHIAKKKRFTDEICEMVNSQEPIFLKLCGRDDDDQTNHIAQMRQFVYEYRYSRDLPKRHSPTSSTRGDIIDNISTLSPEQQPGYPNWHDIKDKLSLPQDQPFIPRIPSFEGHESILKGLLQKRRILGAQEQVHHGCSERCSPEALTLPRIYVPKCRPL